MLSLRLRKVNGVLLLPGDSARMSGATSDEATGASSNMLWTVQLKYGSQYHRTQLVGLATTNPSATPEESPRRTDLVAPSGASGEQEIEFEDKEGENNVDVALLFETAPSHQGTVQERRLFRHSMASIDLNEFRTQPDKRVKLWLPLRPANPHQGDDRDYGAVQVDVMYTEDYVTQGYLYGLFCGLEPPPWLKLRSLSWSMA